MHQSQPHTKKKNMVEVVRVEVSREDSRVKIKKKEGRRTEGFLFEWQQEGAAVTLRDRLMPRPPLPLSQPGVEKKSGHHFQIGEHKQSVVSSVIVLFYTRVTSPFLPHSSDRQTPAVLVHSLNHDEARCLRSWLVKIPTAQRERGLCKAWSLAFIYPHLWKTNENRTKKRK